MFARYIIANILYPCEDFLKLSKTGHRILAEVCMGSFIKTNGNEADREKDRAFSSFNSKRVDFLLIRADGLPVLVIEYQGSGHFRGNATSRDAVKKRVLQRAGIPLIEVFADDEGGAFLADVRKIIFRYGGEDTKLRGSRLDGK